MERFKKQATGGVIYSHFIGDSVSRTQMTPHGNIDIGPIEKLSPLSKELLVAYYREDPEWTECY